MRDLRRFGLHTCNLGSECKSVVNPFTQQNIVVPVDYGFTDEELKAVTGILTKNEVVLIEVVEDEGWATYENRFARFSCFELGGPNQIDGISVEWLGEEIQPEFLEMIMSLAINGNLALKPEGATGVRIVGREPNTQELARWPDAKALYTLDELREWLEKLD